MNIQVLIGTAALLFAAISSAAADVAHLRFNFGPPGPSNNYRHDRSCPLVSMSWIDESGGVVWTRPAPPELRGEKAICECGTEGPDNQMSSAWRPCDLMVRQSRSDAPDWLSFMIGIERRGGVVALAHRSGVIAIAEDDGRTVGEWARPKTSGEYFAADHASYRLDGVPGCRGRTRGPSIIAWCGDLLLYFTEDHAAVLRGPSLRLIASATAHSRDVTTSMRKDSDLVRSRARLRLGRYRLVVEGSYDSHP